MASTLHVAVEVEPAELDRPQVLDVKGVVVLLNGVVRHGHLGPQAPFEQALVVAVPLLADSDALRVEVFQRRPMPFFFLDIANMDLVDEAVLAQRRYLGLLGVGLVGPHIVVLQGGQHRVHAGRQLGLVVAGAETRQQELQHKGRHVGAFLDAVQQVLAHHLAFVDLSELAVQRVHRVHTV